MSWYVRELLLSGEKIRENLFLYASDYYNESSDEDLFYEDGLSMFREYHFDEETYLDLLTVEQKLQELIDSGFITLDENRILNLILTNKTISQIEREESISRPTLIRKFYEICDRIAYHLGGYFTDEGYVVHIGKKYKLNPEEYAKLRKYINEEK
jgi:hypothetical protein